MNWRERILAGDFNVNDAGMWETCAVGEQHAMHPEVVVVDATWSCPLDDVLNVGGMVFWRAVRGCDKHAALATLDAIEDRVLQLKRGDV